jgi:NAD(P)-dependent dehydrogenase (short-subunit alcohol dehydrogenase family)/rhamnose utilization protein RhaD (predicted bifunctional aldolase and dehydrogenase)
MDQALADLIAISRRVGVDTSLVQGGGGNTSVKTADGKYMYIKASGTAIKGISQDRGWRRLRVASVCAIVQDGSLVGLDDTNRENEIANRLRLCCEDEVAGDARPSVEAHLHASLGRCVVHLHPVAVGAYVCAKNGRAALEKLFASEKLPPLWVPAADPGYMLAVTVCRLVSEYTLRHGKAPWALFLEKHGLFVTADSADEVLRRVRKVIGACVAGLPKAKPVKEKQPKREEVVATGLAIRRAIWEATGAHQCVRRFSDESVAAFLARPDAKQLAAAPSMTPDELVYANGSPLWVEKPDPAAIRARLARLLAKGEKPAASFLLKDLGLIVSGNAGALESIKEVVTAALQVRGFTAGFGGVNALSKRQRDFILNWEAESFRKKIAGLSGAGELAGRIAVVTGAGSGLGRSIAVGLAGAGAVVALADIDVRAAEETAGIIAKQSPAAATLAAKCDVTSETEVSGLFDLLLDRWGGVDVLVNAAGIAPPYALIDMPPAKWRAALEINLTGYFLMAQAAARVMIQQGMGGSIINLSSKSGLEASRNNTAYNATKAGEIHMARGWALELGEHGIRVNSVAPGNVFEGSRIWNPEYIRACARKYGIKPGEVIPYYVNMTSLKREVKGQDVANAVIFLCSDKARTVTGQTLVCDSGQVMVR